ncbi:hypothetical protein ACFXPZ_32545 [Streptomyces sp. NPDC059101]
MTAPPPHSPAAVDTCVWLAAYNHRDISVQPLVTPRILVVSPLGLD